MHLEVLIPSVLGLVFIDGRKMCVFNLESMTVID